MGARRRITGMSTTTHAGQSLLSRDAPDLGQHLHCAPALDRSLAARTAPARQGPYCTAGAWV